MSTTPNAQSQPRGIGLMFLVLLRHGTTAVTGRLLGCPVRRGRRVPRSLVGLCRLGEVQRGRRGWTGSVS